MAKFSLFFILIFCSAAKASEAINEQKKLIGKGKFSFLFWDIYNAELYSKNGDFSYQDPFVLKLTYLRNIKGAEIAKSTIDEIRKQGFRDELKLTNWLKLLSKIFPNIKANDSLAGFFLPSEGRIIFYNNNKKIAEIKDKEFLEKFSDIWLSEKTSAPHLRNLLLGKNK